MRLRLALAASLSVCVLALHASADEPAQDDVAKKDTEARTLVVDELSKLVELAKNENAFDRARETLELALLADVKTKELAKDLEELRGKTGTPAPTFQPRWDSDKKEAYEKCTKALSDHAAYLLEQHQDQKWAACLELLDHFPGTGVAAKLGATYFEPYGRFFLAGDAKKLEAGGEFVDGNWLDKAAVTKLDKEHATWENPWVVSDEVHEVRTTARLRTAKTLLAIVGNYRRFFLRRFSGLLDLRTPTGGKLPVIVSETQNDMKARWAAEPRTAGVPRLKSAAAMYLRSGDLSNPCFVTFEPVIGGLVVKVPLEMTVSEMRHEVTHQLAYEYMKWDRQGPSTGPSGWCVEGLATYMQQWKQKGGKWRLAKASREISLGEGRSTTLDPAISWCVKHRKDLVPISTLVAIKGNAFYTVENYNMSGGVCYFLLEGEGGKYRKRFAKLLELVHKGKDDDGSFAACFQGVDEKTLQAEFTKFLGETKLDE